jgi:hypothetical protein
MMEDERYVIMNKNGSKQVMYQSERVAISVNWKNKSMKIYTYQKK